MYVPVPRVGARALWYAVAEPRRLYWQRSFQFSVKNNTCFAAASGMRASGRARREAAELTGAVVAKLGSAPPRPRPN